jgi:hypothetical protein
LRGDALYGEDVTERRGDPGFTVAPQRLGGDGGRGGRSRTRRIRLALVIAVAAAILTVAWLGPRLSGPPHFDVAFFATPTPSPTTVPSPTVRPADPAVATPLPSITRPEGARPTGRVAIVIGALRVIDLATGDITGDSTSNPAAPGAVLPAAGGGGWTCVCFDDAVDGGSPTLRITVRDIDSAGAVLNTTKIATVPSSQAGEGLPPSLSTDVDISDNGQTGIVALAARAGDTWRLTVLPVDVAGRRAGQSADLGTIAPPPVQGPSSAPSGEPAGSDSGAPEPLPEGQFDTYIEGPHVRISPDGRLAFVWANVQRSNPDGTTAGATHAWRVALGPGGSVGAVTRAAALEQLPTYCRDVGFAADDLLASICPVFPDDPAGAFTGVWTFTTMDLDGNATGSVDVVLEPNGYFNSPLFDRANAQVFVWDATGLTITRIDVRSLATTTTTFDPQAESSSGVSAGGGSLSPDWHDGDSAPSLGFGTITAAPGGSRLYAVGFNPQTDLDSGAQASRGVFVIDRATLALLDRWAPAAEYISVTALPEGLAAVGVPGVDADGHPAPWEASLTIHDATDGRVLVRFGQLGTDQLPVVLGP